MLRGSPDSLKERAYGLQHTPNRRRLRMQAGDGQHRLIAVRRLSRDALEQQWPAGERLGVAVGDGQPCEQTPPVVDDGFASMGINVAISPSCGHAIYLR